MEPPIKLFSARSRFFTAARFTKQKNEDDTSDVNFVLSLSASIEKRVNLDAFGSKSIADKDSHWPNVPDYYQLKEICGVGSYALVYSAFCEARGESCAVKILDLKKWNQSELDNLLKEVVAMSSFVHENISTYFSTFVGKEELWLVMKYMEHGSLLDVIRRKQRAESCKHGVFEEDTIATIMSGVVNGLMFLHEHGYIHKDIKADNILIGEDGSVKIADFCITNCISKMRSYIGSPRWAAPEIVKDSKHKYTPKADVWSLGIMSIETATGSPPYHKSSTMKVLLMILLNEPPTLETDAETRDQYDRYGRAFRSFIADCLRKNPSHRPQVKDLLFHSFFKKSKDQNYLRKVFALIPFSQEPRRRQPSKNYQKDPSILREKKKWVLTSDELMSDSDSQQEPSNIIQTSEHQIEKPQIHWQPGPSPSRSQSDDKSTRSFRSHLSKAQKCSLGNYHVILKIRGLNLDTPMVLKTGIQNTRELFDISFSLDMCKETPESVVEDLIRDGLIDSKDRRPVLYNLRKLLDSYNKIDEDQISVTFRLHSEIASDETLCELNLIGYATLTLKLTEPYGPFSPCSTK